MIQGVIFDMDGLMFDTERIWATLWAPALERLGQPAPTEAFVAGARGLAGENMLHYLAENYPACDPQQLLDVVNELGRTALANGAPATGVFDDDDYDDMLSVDVVARWDYDNSFDYDDTPDVQDSPDPAPAPAPAPTRQDSPDNSPDYDSSYDSSGDSPDYEDS